MTTFDTVEKELDALVATHGRDRGYEIFWERHPTLRRPENRSAYALVRVTVKDTDPIRADARIRAKVEEGGCEILWVGPVEVVK